MPRTTSILGVLAATALLLLALTPTPAPAADRTCKRFGFTSNGTPWKATAIRVRGVTCRQARRLIREYAKPRNCQFGPSCLVGPYRCRTTEADGSQFSEQCTRGARRVQWRGSYSPS